MILSMMMAMDQNRLIGANGAMPWHLPGELQYFKRVTLGKPIIMGRRTFESIGKALPGRSNIVLTSRPDWQADKVMVVHNLADALTAASANLDETREAVIIGGAAVCRQAMPQLQKLYLTIIEHAFEGDVWLDSYEPDQWREVSSRYVPADEKQPYGYHCLVLERIHPGDRA